MAWQLLSIYAEFLVARRYRNVSIGIFQHTPTRCPGEMTLRRTTANSVYERITAYNKHRYASRDSDVIRKEGPPVAVPCREGTSGKSPYVEMSDIAAGVVARRDLSVS